MQKKHGFQLMELIISLAMVSILIAFSIPRYSQHLLQARRLEAASMLSKLAIAMEQYYLSHHTYHGANLATLHFPEIIAKNNYQLKIESANDDDYLLLAKPTGLQAEKDILCSKLSLRSTGEKGISGIGKIEDCW